METKGPLDGLKVLDLSSLILGPYTSKMMAEWGADVIKIEAPAGDITRNIGVKRTPGMSAIFMNLNLSKRSIVLDLKKPESKEILIRLVKESDIMIHNYRPEPAKRLGISYQQLAKVNPKLIVCVSVGYGRGGCYSERPAYDDLIQGICGIADLNGFYNQSSPGYVPTALADKVGSLMSLSTILAALYHREKTGIGQEVEVAMFEALVSFLLVEHYTGPTFEPPLGPVGHLRQMLPSRRPFKTKDGFICALPYTDRHWQAIFKIMGHHELVDDERFVNVAKRTEFTKELYQILEDAFKQHSSSFWNEELANCDIPFAPVSSLDDLFVDPHLNEVGLFEEYQHPTEGRLRRVNSPVTFSKTVPTFKFGASHLGEHSREILQEMGFDGSQIENFFEQEVVR
ncbi:MAG: CoA transferase [Piscirickettsiaceae bacterium]|nr:MAG: CoA transferase [Piscirickettsiaceae bacterium]